jgi:hypothetical protein
MAHGPAEAPRRFPMGRRSAFGAELATGRGRGKISGIWSEASRNISGTLQGRLIDGRINVSVEATGFAANLTMTTHGSQQSVTIRADGEIRRVSIIVVRG